MGSRELIDSLRQAGEQKLRELRAAAETEAERTRADARRRIAAIREERERRAAEEEARLAADALADAHSAARQARISAERKLADRLYRAARASLRTLRNVGYEDVFGSFVRELPQLSWMTVKVNPADTELGRRFFPGAEIVPDEGISGGFAVQSADGRMQVVNTFEKRLETSWEQMLPALLAEAEGGAG